MTEVPEQLPPHTVSKRQFIMLIIYLALAVAIVVALAVYVHHQADTDTPAAKHTTSSAQAQQPNTVNKSAVPGTSSAGSAGSGSSSANTASVPNTTACKHLTLAIARQLLGAQAGYTTPAEPANLQAEDTAVSSCAYGASGVNVQLTIRSASSSLGASENSTVFGSDRPAGSSSVQGYGQSAYWNPDDGTLNVLSQNDWYIITGSQHDQSSAQSVADLLKAGF
jgi:hypothetical protein